MEELKKMSIIDLLQHTKGLDSISLKLWSGVPDEFKHCFVVDAHVTIFRDEFTKFHDYLKNIYPINYTFYVDGCYCFCLRCESYINYNK